ncbi:MAG: hypothetical protein GY845_24185 [Planctomycetes bacterium]|nr:hypothetical protein [Planctomycetota bacterium]
MRALKICLWLAGIACLLSLFGTVLPASSWQSLAKYVGVESFPEAPQFIYAIRVGSGTYVGVGVFFIILALAPLKYGVMVPFAALGALFVGVVCLIAGLITAMPFWWFMGDSLSCLVLGVLILVFWQQAKKTTV